MPANAADVLIRNCEQECFEPIEGEISGTIPTWLSGDVLRNGPGLFDIGESKLNHLFDGMAMLHRFHIDKGHITYSNRFLKSDRYVKNIEAQRVVMSELGTVALPDPCKTVWERMMSRFVPKSPTSDNCNVTICTYGDQVYAATESNTVWKISKELDTLEKVDLTNYIAVNHATAHLHVEADGTAYNIGNSYNKGPRYHILRFPPPKPDAADDADKLFKEAEILATIPSRWPLFPAYYHSFVITNRHVIFIEQPLCVSIPSAMVSSLMQTPIAGTLKWFGNYKTRFHIIEKCTGKILEDKYESCFPFGFFHTINAFEDHGHIVLDLCAYNDGDVMFHLYRDYLQRRSLPDIDKETKTIARRFVLPLHPKKNVAVGKNLINLPYTKCNAFWDKNKFVTCDHEDIPQTNGCELPRINYNYNGQKYRYFYSVAPGGAVIKVDWHTYQIWTWNEDGVHATEPIFVQRPEAQEEDDGVVLSAIMHRSDEKKVDLLILDAKSFKELGRARFNAPGSVPFTFHGMFLNSTDKVHKL